MIHLDLVLLFLKPQHFFTVLSNPAKRQEYDKKGILYVQDQNVVVSIKQLFFSVVISSCNGSHTLFFFGLPTISGLPEPAQGANTYLQWSWHKVLSMVNTLRGRIISNCKIALI